MTAKLEHIPIEYWNYRVVVTAEDEEECDLEICEVYYDADDNPLAYSTRFAGGSSLKEIDHALGLMRQALEKPILHIVDGKLVERSR